MIRQQSYQTNSSGLALIFSLGFTAWSVWILTEPLRTPNFEMHFGRWMLIGLFAFLFLMAQWLMYRFMNANRRSFLIWLGLVLAAAVTLSVWGRISPALESAGAGVCNGKWVDGAAEYPAGMKLHPILIIYTPNGRSIKAGDYPPNWRPQQATDLELVACVQDTWKTYDTCTYTGGREVTLTTNFIEVTLVSAKSGRKVTSFTLTGDSAYCSDTEVFSSSQLTKTVAGKTVPLSRVIYELQKYVLPSK